MHILLLPSYQHLWAYCVALACLTDIASRRIPNAACLALALGGFCSALAQEGFAALASVGQAGLLGGGLALVLHVGGALAAGDVKFFAALGTFMAPSGVLPALGAALGIGGLLAALIILGEIITSVRAADDPAPGASGPVARACSLVYVHALLVVARRRQRPQAATTVPYALALAGGALAAR